MAENTSPTEGSSAPNVDRCDNPSNPNNLFQDDIIFETMLRLTNGLPQHELSQMLKETRECEHALAYEIQVLEKAMGLPVTTSFSNELVLPLPPTNTTSSTITSQAEREKEEGSLLDVSDNKQANAADDESSIPTPTPIIPPAYDATVPFIKDGDELETKPTHGKKTTDKNYLEKSHDILKTELTPLDRYFTLSSMLGRLRDPIDTPPPPHSSLAKLKKQQKRGNSGGGDTKKKKKNNNAGANTAVIATSLPSIPSSVTVHHPHQQKQLEKYSKLIHLKETYEIYTTKQTDTSALVAFHKRISNHRTATVFRRPVNPQEAPGYIDRILFPCDLSLVKKMILCGTITTFEELHRKVGLICHNCVKFNGRESDYAHLTRDFENYVDDSILDVMQKLTDKATTQKR